MTTANDVLKAIKDDRIDFIDLRFTDLKGKLSCCAGTLLPRPIGGRRRSGFTISASPTS
jgi:glutamine synthetase